jgi:UDP-N-acetyl-D-mannosaminuronic acid dehydrogenase
MPLTFKDGRVASWRVEHIAVVGPGIVGMPMAALLAHARILEGGDRPAVVTIVQRNSKTSGWKVDAINSGRSPIGGVEPDLDRIVAEGVADKRLRASHDVADVRDADVILVCTQTDKKGFEPDYGPLFEALHGIAAVLKDRPAGNVPLVIFESTLAPSTMATLVKDLFAGHGLVEGRDVLLGNSPNRVMPGRLVERVASSDKIVAGLHPDTPGLIARLYGRIVTQGTLHQANSMTAEVVKTLENAYRDVRIAFAAEVARWCDANDVDFFALRDAANAILDDQDAASADPNAVPSGGLLVPTVGVGGHCLPKDGILLWWRALQAEVDQSRSLILEARKINDDSPAQTLAMAERHFGGVKGKRIALLGTAYRFNSEDTRNSPTLTLARLLLDRGASVVIHDPYVYPTDQNLLRTQLEGHFTRELRHALEGADWVVLCTGHKVYMDGRDAILAAARDGEAKADVVDACNLWRPTDVVAQGHRYCGIGRGAKAPEKALVDAVAAGFRAVEIGVGNEVSALVDFLNRHYAADGFNQVRFADVQRIAGTCVTGCRIANAGDVMADKVRAKALPSRLVAVAAGA